jgi:hypothetical protein
MSMDAQNRYRYCRRATGGRPGDGIAGARSLQQASLIIGPPAHLRIEVLRRPVEFAHLRSIHPRAGRHWAQPFGRQRR